MSADQPLALPVGSADHHGTMLTLPVVAERLGVSLATVRRMLHRKELDGAQLQRGPSGDQWSVPLATVEAVLVKRSKQAAQAPVRIQASAPAQQISEELVTLRKQVLDLERRLAVADALAHERAQELDRLHEAHRIALVAAQPATPPPAPAPAPVVRHWWQRVKRSAP